MGTDELTKMRGCRFRPTVYLCPQVNDNWEFEATRSALEGSKRSDSIWWTVLGRAPNVHAVLMSHWEKAEADARLLEMMPVPPLHRAHDWRLWKYPGVVESERRERRVVWASRVAPLKDPPLAGAIGTLVQALGIDFAAFSGAARAGKRREVPNLTVGLPRELFLAQAGSSMAHIVTSHNEAWCYSLWELAERGVVPVIRDKRWARAALPGWPLFFGNAAEAAAMCEMVVEDYPKWSRKLDEVLRQHWSEDTNGSAIWQAIWHDWLAWDYGHDVMASTRHNDGAMAQESKGRI